MALECLSQITEEDEGETIDYPGFSGIGITAYEDIPVTPITIIVPLRDRNRQIAEFSSFMHDYMAY